MMLLLLTILSSQSNENNLAKKRTITGIDLNQKAYNKFIRDSFENFTYTISNGEVTITGYQGKDVNITIPDKIDGYPVVSIGSSAFNGNIENIKLPNSILNIYNNAFAKCYNLQELILPKSLKYIGIEIISGCSLIKSIIIPKNLSKRYSSSSSPFAGSSIEKVIYEEGSTKIIQSMFNSLSTLKEIILPNSIIDIEKNSFRSCTSLTHIDIPNNVQSIGSFAFGYSGLTSINLPENLQIISESLFKNCEQLTIINISNNVQTIESSAFSGTSITSIIIPKNITIISNGLFEKCVKLVEVILPQNIITIQSNSFNGCSSLAKINPTKHLTTIGDNAFQNCISLTTFDLYFDISKIGENSFNNCKNLTLKLIAGSYSESYALSKNISYIYLYEIVNLNVKINNNTDISGMKIKIINIETNVENTIIASDISNIYTFNGLLTDSEYNLTLFNKYGQIIFEKKIIIIEKNETTVEISYIDIYSLNLTIYDQEFNIVTDKTLISWYNENGSYLCQGSVLTQILKGTIVKYEIDLNESIGLKYHNPQSQTFVITENKNISITLSPFLNYTIEGKLVNNVNKSISGASISISQILNNKYIYNTSVYSNEYGYFSLNAFNVKFNLTISHNNYLHKTITYNDLNENMNIGLITLSDITGKKIYLSFQYKQSVYENEESKIQNQYYDDRNLKFILQNMKSNDIINNFIYQFPYLIIPDYENFDGTIKIEISSDSNEINSCIAYSTPDKPNISVTFVQYGMLEIQYKQSQNARNIVMIYDKENLVYSCDFHMNVAMTTPIIDGDYSVVIMGKSEFFNNIQSLKSLRSSNLLNNKDYVLKKVSIQSGIIKLIKFNSIPHFDESKFYYTDNKKTTFYFNKANGIVGSYFALSCHIEFLKQYESKVSNIKLLIEIPYECKYMEGSLVIDKKISQYTQIENQMIIPVNKDDNVIRLCIIPLKKGTHSTNSFIEFEIDGQSIVQPLKSAYFDSNEMSIYVPKKTGNKTVISFGEAQLGSQILLYCDEIFIGQTNVNNKGEWMIKFDILNPSTFSIHNIYIIAIVSTGIQVKSDIMNLVYNCNHLDVSKITLIEQSGNPIEIDYPYQHNNIFYSVTQFRATLTLTVDFVQNDPQRISNVFVIAISTKNKVTKLPATYDPNTKKWIAQYTFSQSKYPSNIYVEYNCISNLTLPAIDYDNKISCSDYDIKKYEEMYRSLGYEFELIENKCSPEDQKVQFIYNYSYIDVSNQIITSKNIIEHNPISNEELHRIRGDSSYKTYYDSRQKEYLIKYDNSVAYEEKVVDVEKKVSYTKFIDTPYKKNKWDEIDDFISDVIDAYDKISPYMSTPLYDILSAGRSLINAIKTIGGLTRRYQNNKACMSTIDKVSFASNMAAYFTIHAGNFITSFSTKPIKFFNPIDYATSKAFEYQSGLVLGMAEDTIENKGCFSPVYPTTSKIIPLIDPSGYVYEAVESNRIEGVTTTIFEKVIKVDIYGNENEFSEIWDAELYGQKNPLTTDNTGWYAWDVPEGLWQVKYDKQNYETAYSDWLPVPPPQLDVNIPIVSYVNPEIKRVTCYESRVEIEFNKYMSVQKIASNDDYIRILLNDNIIIGNIEFANSENDPNKINVNYASLIYFIPTNEFQVGNDVNVFIKKDVTSYSGISMINDYNNIIKVIKEPKIILDSETSDILYGTTNEINLCITLTPLDSVQNKKLLIETNSSNIIQIESNSIDIDNNEVIQIPVKILSPGVAYISISLDGTGIKVIKTINLNLQKVKLDPVVASIESESCIDVNSFVDLQSNVPTSKIYYSIDDSPDFILYNGSIIITNDTKLTAIARDDNFDESDPVSYFYIVKQIIYIVSFDPNGGTVDQLTKEVQYNKVYGELPLPVKEDYIFGGWYSDQAFQTLITPDTIFDISQNITLYAQWVAKSDSLTSEIIESSLIDEITTSIEAIESNPTEDFQFSVEVSNVTEEQDPTNEVGQITNNNNKSKKGMIIGIVVGLIAAVIIIVVIATVVYKIRKKQRQIYGISEGEIDNI